MTLLLHENDPFKRMPTTKIDVKQFGLPKFVFVKRNSEEV